MAIDLGDVHLLTHTHTAGPNLANAGTMRLEITGPDGVLTTVTPVVAVSIGRYEYAHLTTQAGRHVARWVSTGTNPGASVDVFDVRPSDPGYLTSLAAARAHLNIDFGVHDDELRSFIEAVTPVVEDIVGPVVVRPFAEVHSAGPMLLLHRPPVVALTSLISVHSGASGYLPAEMDVDPTTGIVRRLDGGGFAGPLRVTYTAGRRVVPANITKAAEVILEHLWRTQRGHSGGRPSQADDEFRTPAGFLIPHLAMQMLAPDRRSPVMV